jgi:hypothetical protein
MRYGIYDFKDGNLRICYSLDDDVPAALRTTTDRPEEVLMILQRIAAAGTDPNTGKAMEGTSKEIPVAIGAKRR